MQRLTGMLLNHFHSPIAFRQCLLYSSSTSTDCFAKYFVDSLGFSHQQALSASTKLSKHKKVYDTNFNANANSVVTFFRHYGFNDTHLRKIVSYEPRVLCSNFENTILPKFKFLQDHGFSQSDLFRVISVNPTVVSFLLLGIETYISPALGVFRKVLGSDTLVISAFKNLHNRHSGDIIKNLIPNFDLMTAYGIPIEFIRKHIVYYPSTFSQNPEKFKEMVIKVENNLGIARNAPMFLYGIHLLCRNSEEAIQSKCRMFKSFGWSQSDVDTLMMKNPSCFGVTDTTIKKKLEFLMGDLQLKPAQLITKCAFFTCSLEKRIMPRHKVLLILKEKGLLKKNVSLYVAICMTESRFLDMFVIPFKEVHEAYAKHAGCNLKTLTQERPRHGI